jgi:hypothetical protein
VAGNVVVSRAVSANHCVAEWDAFLVVIWRQLTTKEGIAAVGEALDHVSAAGQKVGVVIVIEPTAAPPSSAARKGLAEVFSSRADVVVAVAVVPDGSGFRASMVRGVVTGLSLLARFPYPYKVFNKIDSATAWLAPQVGGAATKAALLANAIAQLRRQLDRSDGGAAASPT